MIHFAQPVRIISLLRNTNHSAIFRRGAKEPLTQRVYRQIPIRSASVSRARNAPDPLSYWVVSLFLSDRQPF